MSKTKMMRRRTGRRGGSDKELHYRGPIRFSTGGLDSRVTRANLDLAIAGDSNASGQIIAVFSSSDVTSCTDWSSFSNVYQEYRVVAMQLRWLPRFNATYTSSATPGTGAGAVWHIPTVPTPASVDDIVQNANYHTWNTGGSLAMTFRARGTEEMAWISTGFTSSHGGFSAFANGCTPSNGYGRWFLTFTVEFRGRK